jgi:hypothetical protein
VIVFVVKLQLQGFRSIQGLFDDLLRILEKNERSSTSEQMCVYGPRHLASAFLARVTRQLHRCPGRVGIPARWPGSREQEGAGVGWRALVSEFAVLRAGSQWLGRGPLALDRRNGTLPLLPGFMVLEPAFQQTDRGGKRVVECEQQVDVVAILLAAEAMGPVVAWADRGQHFAAARPEEAERAFAPAGEPLHGGVPFLTAPAKPDYRLCPTIPRWAWYLVQPGRFLTPMST